MSKDMMIQAKQVEKGDRVYTDSLSLHEEGHSPKLVIDVRSYNGRGVDLLLEGGDSYHYLAEDDMVLVERDKPSSEEPKVSPEKELPVNLRPEDKIYPYWPKSDTIGVVRSKEYNGITGMYEILYSVLGSPKSDLNPIFRFPEEYIPVPPKYITKSDPVERDSFANGAVRDTQNGKPRYALIPPPALKRLADAYARGAEKYDDFNYLKGMPTSRIMDSLMRHVEAYRAGDRVEDHLAAIAWNSFAIMMFEDTKWDDTLKWKEIWEGAKE